MFNSKPKTLTSEKDNNLNSRLDQDFIVHNMPSPVCSSTTLKREEGVAPGNHKKTGLIIIILGTLLIVGMVYVAYILMIKPTTTNNQTQKEEQLPALANNPEPTNLLSQAPISSSPLAPENNNPTTTIESSITPVEPEVVAIPKSATLIDADSDGLSDAEEQLIGSNPDKIDSDGDGNTDLIEIKNSYNPAGNGRLASSSRMVFYRNSSLKYSFIYPKDWILKSLNGNETIMVSSADENYFVQIIHQVNQDGLNITDWYQKEFSGQAMGEALAAGDASWQGVFNLDRSVFYLNNQANKSIYVFSLGSVEGSTVDFVNLFELIINNFRLNSK